MDIILLTALFASVVFLFASVVFLGLGIVICKCAKDFDKEHEQKDGDV